MSIGTVSRGVLPIALIVLATATTVVVATEFIVVGLLPLIAQDMNISTATAGYLVSAFALSASLLGPPLAWVTSAQPARRVMTVTLLFFAGTNLAGVLWPSFSTLLALRVVQGAMLPVFLGAGASAVTSLAIPERRGFALALANTGFAAGVVIGLPAGVALANNGLWTPPLVALAIASLAAAALVAVLFPAIDDRTPPSQPFAQLLGRWPFLVHLALSTAVFTAMFAAYTYLTVWLQQIAGLAPFGVARALFGFGVAGVLGNAAAAFVADRRPLRATLIAATALALAVAGLSMTDRAGSRILLFALWGVAHTASVVLCQVRVTLAGRSAPAFAMALNISAANLGIALGAALGGWVVTRWSVNAIGWGPLGLLPVIAGFVVMLAARQPGAGSRKRKT